VAGDDESIAAVVAGARDDEDALRGIRRDLARDFRGGEACAFHERQRIGRGGRSRFDAAYFRGEINGSGVLQGERHDAPSLAEFG
jgi:hypothetical protein